MVDILPLAMKLSLWNVNIMKDYCYFSAENRAYYL